MNLVTFFVPLAVELLKLYFQNTSSKHDDKVLEVVKDSMCYLADKENNDVSYVTSFAVDGHSMTGLEYGTR